MLKYFLQRFGLGLITFVISIFLFFLFVKLMPDYHKALPGTDDIAYKLMVEKEWLDRSIPEQFFRWIYNIFYYKEFGLSKYYNTDVAVTFFSRIPATISFQIIPYILSIIIGVSLGILAALKKNKTADNVISVSVMVLISVPSFVVALLSQYLFVWQLKWLPSAWVATPSEIAQHGPGIWFITNILPIAIMTITSCAGWARSVRLELTEQLTQDYMLLARAKGLSHKQATIRHALRNAMVPFTPSLLLGFIGLMYGSMTLEQVFRVTGTGELYVNSFNHKDYPMLLMILVFQDFLGFILAIISDMSYTLMDPRMRVGSTK